MKPIVQPLSVILVLAQAGAAAIPALASTRVSPSTDLAAAVVQSPPGTAFLLSAGEYRLQEIIPKDGDSFEAEGKVVLNGSALLKFERTGTVWAAHAAPKKIGGGRCSPGHPLCTYPEDMFVDDRLYEPVSQLETLASGQWFFDRDSGTVYLRDDPTGRRVELSSARTAFSGAASDVRISHLIVEKYATPGQLGAIGDRGAGSGWTVEDCEVRWNHGTGVQVGAKSTVQRNFVHHNGQKGVGGHGVGLLIDHNEIAFNNVAGYDAGWEAGGTKFSKTDRLVVSSNNVHDNDGAGLWTDGDNIHTLYENNVVTNNSGPGIAHEISYDAIIRGNTCKGNGSGTRSSLWGSQIMIQNSSHVEVLNNEVVVAPEFGNGIGIINQARGSGAYGPHVASDDYVHDNRIVYTGRSGRSGLAGIPATALNDRFDHNVYTLPPDKVHRWEWLGIKDANGLRSVGQEPNGTMSQSR